MFVRISGHTRTGVHRGRRDDPGPGRRGQDWSWNRNRPGSRVHQVQQGNGIVIVSKAFNAHLQSSAPVTIPKTGKIFGQIFQQTIFADVPDKLPVWDTDSFKCALTFWERQNTYSCVIVKTAQYTQYIYIKIQLIARMLHFSCARGHEDHMCGAFFLLCR